MARTLAVIALFAVFAFPAPAQDAGDAEPFVVICPLEEMVDDGMAVVAERAAETAAGAEAIIFVVDTPGGRVDSCLDIVESILALPCHTISYIKGMGAISAGAIISYA